MKTLKAFENCEPQNLFLNSLPDEEYKNISPFLEFLDCQLGEKLQLPDRKIDFVYFPVDSVASVVTNMENGSSIENGIVGREGIVGFETILYDEVSQREVNVQLAGKFYRLKSDIFKAAFDDGGVFRKKVLQFVGAFLTQISQNGACFAFHQVEQRFSRWLLMFDDRTEGEELKLTQEFIALMLGIHRPSVSKTANKLQEKGIISYRRGKITILNRKDLESHSCECYQSNLPL